MGAEPEILAHIFINGNPNLANDLENTSLGFLLLEIVLHCIAMSFNVAKCPDKINLRLKMFVVLFSSSLRICPVVIHISLTSTQSNPPFNNAGNVPENNFLEKFHLAH